MKNVIKTFGIIAVVAIIGFSLAACDTSPSGGLFNITGDLPGTPTRVIVYNNFEEELTLSNVNRAMRGLQATGRSSSLPFILEVVSGVPFTQTGRFTVVVSINNDYSSWIKTNVQFTNGSATVRATDLKRILDLPRE